MNWAFSESPYFNSSFPVSSSSTRQASIAAAAFARSLDFSDNTLKTVGWTQKTQVLTEVGSGYYRGTLSIASFAGTRFFVARK